MGIHAFDSMIKLKPSSTTVAKLKKARERRRTLSRFRSAVLSRRVTSVRAAARQIAVSSSVSGIVYPMPSFQEATSEGR